MAVFTYLIVSAGWLERHHYCFASGGLPESLPDWPPISLLLLEINVDG